jgi:hypothetical protein
LDIQRWVLRWDAQSLTVEHRTERKATSSELLACFEAEGETFLSQTVTADDTWGHNFHRRQKSNQWNGTIHKHTKKQIQKASIRGQGLRILSSGLVKE